MLGFGRLLDAAASKFDALLGAVADLVDRGHLAAWFAWLEWIGVTSLILALGLRTGSGFLLALGGSCAALLVLGGMVAVERLRVWQQDELRARIGAKFAIPIATAFGSVAIYVMTTTLVELIPRVAGD